MNYLKIAFGIVIALAASRFIPHPPNFTSLIALSFYIPALLGARFLPALLVSFIFTDLIIGFHSTILFTWGSVLIVGFLSSYFNRSLNYRLVGVMGGATMFYLITNFGVWSGGSYGYNLEGLINCYFLALPFFGNTLISTIIFSVIIETIYKFYKVKIKKELQES